VPLTVTFSDQSSGAVDSHVWDYGDGSTSLTTGGTSSATSTLTHTHQYTLPGVYSVTLTVSGLGGSDTLTRTDYITVTWPIVSRVITYTYDPLYRLTGADYSTGEQFEYAYDEVGNPVSTSLRGTNCRTVQTQTLTSTTVTTYTYDQANRLDYFYEDGVPTDLTWDANSLVTLRGLRRNSC
jgi:YD repeat-containing protein